MVKSKYDKSLSACFSGHRIIPYFHLKRLEPQLRTAIISAYADGCRNFFCGCLCKALHNMPYVH